ncbi:MAG TPA: prepilin-type N-terminal cleavage/methylation domain-containing protein [bacterium]|nr:prepilin-type N-terminal cleavage/methylation domain-containing protein [bacterium]
MRHRNNPESGFTIVELMLVLVLIVILVKMFVPHYDRGAITKHEIYSTAHDLGADLRYARRLSVGGGVAGNTNKVYYLKFYTVGSATDTWRIYEDGDEANPIKSVTVLNGVRLFSTDTPSIYFDSAGSPGAAVGGKIDVFDEDDLYRWSVSVVKNTGKVELHEIH